MMSYWCQYDVVWYGIQEKTGANLQTVKQNIKIRTGDNYYRTKYL